ncbi:hypothetical protein [Streptomyces sp. NEAU-W12]|uniref:hypothetical protein n=1 Tax=Streptomyces sp. NEAU-W12 TaxID=2994668 RepID=UPI00224AFED3|nr:hypothetical protein [Streptomyces sp. NEAU-W12]MCX2926715.1 hypothetical protein [Streptomyces sp. NEAU-W12]
MEQHALSPADSRGFLQDIAGRRRGDTTVLDVVREEPFCAEGPACFRPRCRSGRQRLRHHSRLRRRHLTDSRDALRRMILDITAGRAGHLL